MKDLEEYRDQIDALDEKLIDLLARRFDIVSAVGHLKSQENLSVVQPERAQAVIDRAASLARVKGLDPDFVRKIYEDLIDHAHKLENSIKAAQKSSDDPAA